MTPLVINITAQNNTGPGVAAATAQVAALNNAVQGTATATASGSTATSNLARNMLNLAQVADDAQYGFRAIVNQIPMLVQGFGLGMGVAGALQMAGVAYNILSTHVWGAEKALDKETETLREAADAARKKANATHAAAEAANAMEEGAAAAAERLEAIAESYKKATAAADVHLSSLRAEVGLQKELREAQQARALAEVDAKEATGQYGAREAAEARRMIKGQGAEASLAEDEKIAAGEIAAAEAKRQAARQKAAELEAERRRTEAARGPILDEVTRKATEDELKAEVERAAEKRDRQKKLQERVNAPLPAIGYGMAPTTVQREAAEQERKEAQDKADKAGAEADAAGDRARALNERLQRDKAARNALGVGGAEDLEKRRQQIEKDIAAAREAEAAAARERDASKARIGTRRQVAGLERETSNFEGEAERGRFSAQEEKDAEREAQKAAQQEARERKEQQRLDQKRAAAARKGLGGLGLNPAQLQAAEQQIAGYEQDSNEAGMLAFLGRVEGLMRSLARQGQKSREEYTKAMARIAELEAMFKNDRD